MAIAQTSSPGPAIREFPDRGPKHAVYWRETEYVEPGPPLQGDFACDVCIVGGGYTGLWAAHFLKRAEPSIDVMVLEADFAGAGASGHNDGFVTPTIGHSLHTVVRQAGPGRAREAYVAVGRSILELRRFCRSNEIEADLEPSGFYLVATNDHQRRRLEGDAALASSMGVSYEVLGSDEARGRIGSEAITGALKTPGAMINPHRLVRGLLRKVREQGVEVCEQSPAVLVEPRGSGHEVITPMARVRAGRVVLATNAYQHSWGRYRRAVKPVWSYAAVTEPLHPDRIAAVDWPGREGFVEARNFIVFLRFTADNRLLVGGGPAPYFPGADMGPRHLRNGEATRELRRELGRFFPPWRDLPFSHSYGGCIAVTPELVPHVGRAGDGIFHAYGYCGNGIAPTHLAGKVLADLVLGRESDLTDLFFVNRRPRRFPPEPLAYLGVRSASALLGLQDRHPTLLRRQIV